MPTRILIVDDDYDLRVLCVSILHSAGIEAVAAGSAEEGMEILEREPCDLAVLDVRLPGMSGLEALKAVAVKWPTLPVLLASAPGEAGDEEARAHGARGFLAKPFSAEDLLAKIDEAMGSSGAIGHSRGGGRRTDTVKDIVSECKGIVVGLRARLAGLRELPDDHGLLDEMYRSACAAKGLIDFIGLPGVTDATSRLAGELRRLRDGEAALTRDAVAEIDGASCRLIDVLSGLKGRAGSSAGIRHAPLPDVLAGTAAPGGAAAGDGQSAGTLVAELSRCLPEVLSAFGARRAKCCEVVQRLISRSSASLTVAIDIEACGERGRGPRASGPFAFAAVFEFELEGARAFAEAIAMSTLGEPILGPPEEREELIEGALGELANRAVSGMVPATGSSFGVSGPYFFRGAGEQMCDLPQALSCFRVESDLGSFEAGILAGAVPLEGEGARRIGHGSSERTRRVLVAHHSAVMRKMLRRTLERAGFEVAAEAGDGRRAAELFRSLRPDLVVLGLNMPVMGGLDALRIIRADDPGAKVLVCSALTEGRAIRRGLRAGAVGYVTMPIDPPGLIQAVQSLFQAREPSRTAAPAALGVSALGAYRVGELVAGGGMADVYRGYDPGLGREVALKVMKDELACDVDFVVQFLNEARAVASVNHPNVVSVYFAGSDRGKHFFAMEFLPGPDLEYLVKRDNVVLPEHEVLEYIAQAAEGLAAADRQGLVHCDIKPTNLVLGTDGHIKVTDFGIARHGRADPGSFGTPAYSSPEQTMGHEVDRRSDIYSLGATLYFLVDGTPPYVGNDDMEVALRHIHDPLPRLKTASRRVNKLLARMMSKSPDARHATYDELIGEIGRLV